MSAANGAATVAQEEPERRRSMNNAKQVFTISGARITVESFDPDESSRDVLVTVDLTIGKVRAFLQYQVGPRAFFLKIGTAEREMGE